MNNIYKFDKQKSANEAIIFYVVTFGLSFGFLFGLSILVMLLAAISGNEIEDQTLLYFGNFMVVVVTVLLGYLIMKKRGDFSSTALILACVAFILSTVAGLLGGLAPLAYLTTRPLKGGDTEGESQADEGEQTIEAEPAQEPIPNQEPEHENN